MTEEQEPHAKPATSKQKDVEDPDRQLDRAAVFVLFGGFFALEVTAFGVFLQFHQLDRTVAGALLAVVTLAVLVAVASRRELDPLELIPVIATGFVIVAMSILMARSGWLEHRAARERDRVEATVDGAAKEESQWFRAPATDRTRELEDFYAMDSPGLAAIEDAVAGLRSDHCRWARSSNQQITVRSISVNGSHATVRTFEYYRQPLVCNGTRSTTSRDDSQPVTYDLEKSSKGWRIFSNSARYLR
jgi:hypothetical protein